MSKNKNKYYHRKIDDELLKWKEDTDRKPLLLRGARQVGKSSAVKKLAESFDYFIEVNFEQNKDLENLFTGNINPKEICSKLSAIYGIPIVPNKTLLFFDEIQDCIPAITSLRFFYENFTELHLVAAGSLLEFALSEIPSFGVGRIRSIFMYPFSFDEFLSAIGETILLEHKQSANNQSPLSEAIHNKLINYFKTYLIIGGMPKVVKSYIETHDLLKCQQEITDIILTYSDDFSKYKKRVQGSNISKIFRSIAKFSGQKFIYSQASESMNVRQIKEILDLLLMAGLVIPVTHSSGNGIPLGAETNEKYRKFLIFDNGIAQQLAGLNIADIIIGNDFESVNKGYIAELFAGLELIKYGSCYQRQELYYWHREDKTGNAEVDYLIEYNFNILPIEIKSSTKGSMQSLYYFIDKKKSSKGLRCSLENFSSYGKIEVLPLYAISNLFEKTL